MTMGNTSCRIIDLLDVFEMLSEDIRNDNIIPPIAITDQLIHELLSYFVECFVYGETFTCCAAHPLQTSGYYSPDRIDQLDNKYFVVIQKILTREGYTVPFEDTQTTNLSWVDAYSAMIQVL